jgi:hypothetical protein
MFFTRVGVGLDRNYRLDRKYRLDGHGFGFGAHHHHDFDRDHLGSVGSAVAVGFREEAASVHAQAARREEEARQEARQKAVPGRLPVFG